MTNVVNNGSQPGLWHIAYMRLDTGRVVVSTKAMAEAEALAACELLNRLFEGQYRHWAVPVGEKGTNNAKPKP